MGWTGVDSGAAGSGSTVTLSASSSDCPLLDPWESNPAISWVNDGSSSLVTVCVTLGCDAGSWSLGVLLFVAPLDSWLAAELR